MEFWPEEMVLARTLNHAQGIIDCLGLAAWQDQRNTTISKHFTLAKAQLAVVAFQAGVSGLLAEDQLSATDFAHLTGGAHKLAPDCLCWVGHPLPRRP